MSLEGIELEHFTARPQTNINSTTATHQRHAVFYSFLFDDSKKDVATTTAHSKHLISFLKEKKMTTTSLSKIWENPDGCAKQYRCASAMYLMSDMSQCYSIIIDRGISAPGHGKEVMDGINAVNKRCIYQLMYTVQLHGSIIFDSNIQMHTGTEKDGVSLAKEFQEHLTKEHRRNGVIDEGKQKRFMEIKWIDREYHAQDNADVEHKYVKIYCNTNKFPELSFSGPY